MPDQSPPSSPLAEHVKRLAADLTRPRFHTWCGETHVPGPCADGVLRPDPASSLSDVPAQAGGPS